ncbi:MAG TPA: hypothetical protein EYN54_10200 [Methylococcaceae bacterium]|nr:hypothetical protein [Methylococcaceae bacterium]
MSKSEHVEITEKQGHDSRFYITSDQKGMQLLQIRRKDGKIRFKEMCDEYFTLNVSKKEALDILNQAIDFINSCEGE